MMDTNCNHKDKHLLTKECLIDKLEIYEQVFLMIAHNLKGNLANIQGLLEIYPQKFENEQQKQLFSYIKGQTDNMDMAINEVENFIKINAEQYPSSQYTFFDTILTSVLLVFEKKIQETKTKVSIYIQKDAEKYPKVHWYNILYNLVSNSLKYRKVEETPEISITLTQSEDNIARVIFRDNGIGMDLDKNKNIFDFSTRLENGREKKGNGWGLYMVSCSIKALKATIDVDSRPQKGTTFIIEYPLA